MNKWIVVTTINKPTIAINKFAKMVEDGWSVVVVGDRKTPDDWYVPGIDYLSIERQDELFGDLSRIIPYNHYCRKNLGYLYAIKNGAQCILETDDDNIPYESFGKNIDSVIAAKEINGARWINIYKYFTEANIWPRGLPLDEINSIGNAAKEVKEKHYPIQQFLADEDPDVDAIYRLVVNKEVVFSQNNVNYELSSGCWTPFNSQNTLFFPNAFHLLYLPCHVSFRMTDIWRSFVAQRALWIDGYSVVFRDSTVRQVRNEHDLNKDFAQEIPGYIENNNISKILDEAADKVVKSQDKTSMAMILWSALSEKGIVPREEMPIIEGWMSSLKSIVKQGK